MAKPHSSCEITASGGGFNGEYVFEHNTWFGGFGKNEGGLPGFAAFQYSESGNNKPGQLKSFRSNLMWNPQLAGKEASFCKLNDVHSMFADQKDGPPIQDVGDPKDIDYNTGWNYTPDKEINFPNKAKYKNFGKGYIGNFSKTPGEHDVDVDPEFVDYQRDVQLFATKCLGQKPSRGQWQARPDKPYAVGDTVLNTTGILWNQPVLYRYVGDGQNPQPGLGTRQKGDTDQWRKSWEWASLHSIREGVRSGQKFGEDDIIMHLIKWIRAGYAPTNPKLKGAAHDGGDIGAVPWQAKPAASAPAAAAGHAASSPNVQNLLLDPSFDETQPPNRFGHVFKKWVSWKFDGDCEARNGRLGHTGRISCLLFGASQPKIRAWQNVEKLPPGRYRITAWLRGLDIADGQWGLNAEFMFNGKYMQLGLKGTFGWTLMTYVGEVREKGDIGPSFGLMAPGYFWIDDVTMEKVGQDVPLTEAPVLGKQEAPIQAPGAVDATAVRCTDCTYRNMPAWKNCYGCGTALDAPAATKPQGPPLKLVTSFEEEKSAWTGSCTITDEHATDGKRSMRVDKNWAVLEQAQDWSPFDYLKIDCYTDAKDPVNLQIVIKDPQSTNYWTWVNYFTVVPPGSSTLIIPVKQLYVGEKQFPGRMLLLGQITHLTLMLSEKPQAPVFFDNIRLERDDEPQKVRFDELIAYDLGPSTGPLMEGFTKFTPATTYSPGRGCGLKDASVWRAFDVLQPDPLYQDSIAIQKGGIAVDVPNGKYRVCVNIDFAGGFWGEVAKYRNRKVLAEGKVVVNENMDFEAFKRKRYQSWDVEVLPTDDTFDVFQKRIFTEKVFDVDVQDGQLNVDFEGSDFTCAVSSFIAFPLTKTAEGEKFLKYVENRRRFHFDNNSKRVLHRPTGDALEPGELEKKRGYVAFCREFMRDLYYNDTPLKAERGRPFAANAFAGEIEPISVCLAPLQDLGKVAVTVSDLAGPGGKIPASAIATSYVSYRLMRSNLDGTVHTIVPRTLMPKNSVNMPKDIARRFLLTVNTPADAKPGVYKGVAKVHPEKGQAAELPVEFTVHSGTLDPLDIPAGPIGYTADVPWFEDDPAAKAFNQKLTEAGLKKMREYGMTFFCGAPTISYKGCKDGKPDLDFSAADPVMKLAKELGFLAVNSYGAGIVGINAYARDMNQMNAAGFKDYSEFIKAVYTEVQKHADAAGWIPVYWCLGDEPMGDALTEAIANAEAYRKAFPKGPPFFTAYSSYAGQDPNDPAFKFAKALHLPTWAGHSEESISLLKQETGGEWAFYNAGTPRWIYGDYLYKGAKLANLKNRGTWHWNNVYGDPNYCLDGRAEDFSHMNGSPDGTLILEMIFEHSREGIDDYRRLLTLARLCKEKKGTPAAEAGEKLIADRMASFKLGQVDHEPMFPVEDYDAFRGKVNEAIDALRK